MRKHDLSPDEILRAAAAYVAIEQSEHKRWSDLEYDYREAMRDVHCGCYPFWNSTLRTSLAVPMLASDLRRFLPEISRWEAERAMQRLLVDSPSRIALRVLERYASEVANYISPLRRGGDR